VRKTSRGAVLVSLVGLVGALALTPSAVALPDADGDEGALSTWMM
jgi:hypothetical protein